MLGLFITFLVGLFFLLGYLVVYFGKGTKTIEYLSISIALGTMIGLIIFDLIPEVMEHLENLSIIWIIIFIIVGIILLKMLDLFVPDHDHEHGLHHECTDSNLVHIGIVSLIAIVLHNIIEGMAIYNVVSESFKTGLLIGLGVGLHNIPMGMVISSTIEHESFSRKVLFLSLAIFSTFFGGLLMFLIHSFIKEFFIGILIAITLGMILYIALFELVPHILHGNQKKLSFVGILIGFVLLFISLLFE